MSVHSWRMRREPGATKWSVWKDQAAAAHLKRSPIKTLADLQAMFPIRPGACASTGYIPIDFVNENLTVLAGIVKQHSLRRKYRGPRHDMMRLYTRRGDAYAMVLYRN